jgi:ribokinase
LIARQSLLLQGAPYLSGKAEIMPRILVVGSSNTDMTVRLPRLPAPGQTVLGRSFATSPGGKGANQAVAAGRAGGEVVFITAVGDDDLGKRAIDLFRGHGIDISHIRVCAGVSSGVALIFVGDDGENMIGVASGANHELRPEDIDHLPDSVFGAGDVLLVGLEIPIETAVRAIERGSRAGMRVILNPAPIPSSPDSMAPGVLALVDVLTPNRLEALALARMSVDTSDEPDWKQCGDRLLETGVRAVVITLGAQGCLVATTAAKRRIPAPQVDAIDTVGAGDVFNGALAVALCENRSLEDAAGWATAAAALAVTQAGAQSALPFRAAIDKLAARTRIP